MTIPGPGSTSGAQVATLSIDAGPTLDVTNDSDSNPGSLTSVSDIANAGTMQLGDSGSSVGDNLSIGGTLTNTGTLETEGELGSTTQTISGNIDNQASFTINSSTHLDPGVIDDFGTMAVADGATLTNVDDTLVVEPGGTFTVGSTGTYTQDSSATLGITVDATTTTFTGISGGNTNLDGTLQVTTTGIPPSGSTWAIIVGASRSGTFATDDFGGTPYTVDYLSTGVTLAVPTSASTPTLSTISSGGGPVGGSFTDSATLSGFADTVTGETVRFSLYPTLGDCTGDTDAVSGSPVTANLNPEGVTPQSGELTVDSPGTYYWQASYPGDASNKAVTSPCSSEQIPVGKASTSISTHSTIVGDGQGSSVTFSATLTSQVTGQAIPGQTITFTVTGPLAFLLNPPFGRGGSCTGITNRSGVATCSLPGANLGVLFLSPNYTAAFAGSPDYLGSSARGKINALGALL